MVLYACVLLPVATAQAQSSLTPGGLTAYSTIHAIGYEWDLSGDTDHDAYLEVAYRPAAGGAWAPASRGLRVDVNGRNMLAGSVMFLTPGTAYALRLTMVDPDGGGDTREVTVATRDVPRAPTGRVFHVVPGSGGGSGAPEAPFRGIAAAQAVAVPGDTFLLHAGDYGGRVSFERGGHADAHIAWKGAGDGEVRMAGIDITASHVWLEGLTVRDQFYGTRTDGAPAGVVLIRSTFLNNFYSIFLSGGGSDWYIADNTIVGATSVASQLDDGEGIELNMTGGHTVAHNRITNVADGISYPRTNVDIFGNDIFDTADDGIELDFGRANVRVWGNRVHNAYHNGVSFQPQEYGPWYIVRNQIVGSVESPLKFRTTDRFVLMHNTLVNYAGGMICCNQSQLLRGVLRNNLWISATGGQIWAFEALNDWRTDIDYDGVDWGGAAYPLMYGGQIHYDLPSFSRASGLQAHGVRIFRDGCFADFQVHGPPPTPVPAHVMALHPWCNAVDAGAVVPNLTDGYLGAAPDLGAHEVGAAVPVYGPRAPEDVPPAANLPPAVTLVSPAAGATFAAPGAMSIQADVHDADGGVVLVDFFANGVHIGSRQHAPFEMAWTGVPAGTYTLTARATDDRGATASSSGVAVVVAAAVSEVPAPWATRDVGAVAIPGHASVSGGVWTVSGSGSDIWGAADAFRFVHQPLTGDGVITARVTALAGSDPWTKAGVMMRASLASDAAHAALIVTPHAHGVAFQRRTSTGGTSTHLSGGAGTAPVWLRLTRTGATITASRSDDGIAWTTIGSDIIAADATMQVGLAVTSHDNSQLASASFETVSVTGVTAPAGLPAPWTHGNIGAAAGGGTAVTGGTWTVTGSGADIWGTVDGFQFASQPLAGDGVLTARVSGVPAGHEWAKAGIMLRNTTAPDSAHAFLFVTPQGMNGVALQARRATSGDTSHLAGVGLSAPVWLRLTRQGTAVAAEYSIDGVNWVGLGSTTVAFGATIQAGFAVTSHDAASQLSAVFDNVSLNTAAAGETWVSRDIGRVGATGSSWSAGPALTVTGSGADVWGTEDAFHFVSRALSGNFDARVRVTSVDAVHLWTKAGLMVRATDAAGSAHAFVFATPTSDKGVAFQRRAFSGAESVHTAGPQSPPALWLRLVRQGTTITAYYRFDSGGAWTAIGSDAIALSSGALVGAAVTSHADGVLASAIFEDLSITPLP
jgi:regulation of enolase protein 1 (concanavalin A-like superfamily)